MRFFGDHCLTAWSALTFQGEEVINRVLANGISSDYSHQANGRVYELYHHNDNASPSWPQNNISARFYGFASDGQVTWEERIPDGGASGSVLDNNTAGGSGTGTGNAYAYNLDHSLSIFGTCPSTAAGSSQTVPCSYAPSRRRGKPNHVSSHRRQKARAISERPSVAVI